MSKIMELADRYAAICEGDGRNDEPDSHYSEVARAALAAEVEKLEAEANEMALIGVRSVADVLALRAELESARKELSMLDVMLEECKMDWSGDVTQIKAEHKHELDALREKLASVEKDAARYRWLRERDDWVLMPGMRSEVCLRSNLDDQIDLSMGAFIGATK